MLSRYKLKALLLIATTATALVSPAVAQDGEQHQDPKIISYLLGGDIGGNMKRTEIKHDLDRFVDGMKCAFDGKPLEYTEKDRVRILNSFSKEQQLPGPLVEEIVSYLMGGNTGAGMKRSGMEFDLDSFVDGLRTAYDGKEFKYSKEERRKIINAFTLERQIIDRRNALMAVHGIESAEQWSKLADDNQKKGSEFLKANAQKSDIKTTESGLQYMVVKKGSGEIPKATDRVKATYQIYKTDGTKSDEQARPDESFEFQVQDEISGLSEAVQLMPVGSEWKLFIPSELAYADLGRQFPAVGPNETVVIDVQLEKIITPTFVQTASNVTPAISVSFQE